jgi:hypothetical protein
VTSWQIEKDGSSTATLEARGEAAVLRFQLGSGRPAGQYVALAASAGAEPIEGMVLQLSSAQPMRVSVQVRVPGGPDGRRWRRSFYLDSGTRDIDVRLSDLAAVDRSPLRPVVARVQSILVVVDTVNTLPGTKGEFTIHAARVQAASTPTSSR